MSRWSDIYRRNIWRGTESRCGPGSGSAATRHVAPALAGIVTRYGITSVVDVACGDGFWMPDLPNYIGIDIVPEAIKMARQRHPERTYFVADFFDTDVTGDMFILRDVLQHLQLQRAVSMVRWAMARSEFLLASSYRGGVNTGLSKSDLMAGLAYDNDLEQPPFDLGSPLEAIPDGYAYEGDAVRDERKILGLWASR